jgi:hypothetical protein
MLKHLMFSLFFAFTILYSPSFAQKPLSCGLITRVSLAKDSRIITSVKNEQSQLATINQLCQTSTFLNKVLLEKDGKWIISMYTKGTVDQISELMDNSKIPFLFKQILVGTTTGINYHCYCFKVNNFWVNRMIFAEKDLTLVLVFDMLSFQQPSNPSAIFNAAIPRLSFLKK